jgi:hypothetical protein
MRSRSAALAVALLAASALVGSSGCIANRLGQRAMKQAETLPELQYQQVLDNLARFADNPSALPSHVKISDGTTQITDSGNAGVAVDLGPPATTLPQLIGSRTVVVQWGMTPVIDASELRLMRIAYRRALGSPEMPDPAFLDDLAHELKNQLPANADQSDESLLFYEYSAKGARNYSEFDARVATTNDDEVVNGPDALASVRSPLAREVRRQVDGIRRDLEKIQPGWFHVGSKRDIPRDACYVGRHGDRYVWVGADGREALTEFTLTVMKLASLIKETQPLFNPGQVKFSPGDRG